MLTLEERNILILDHMHLVEITGRKYAKKHDRHPDECVAEAYFQLVLFFEQKYLLWKSAENPIGFMRLSIARRISDYFRRQNNTSESIGNDVAQSNSELKLIDWLQDYFPDYENIFNRMRDGFTLDELEMLTREYYTKIKHIKHKRQQLVRLMKQDSIKNLLQLDKDVPTPPCIENFKEGSS
jgi:hypothetical protein